MRLQCLVCKHQFERPDRFVILAARMFHESGIVQGVSLAICTKHLAPEITDALLLHTIIWSDHGKQAYAEHKVFGD